jgi:hypothetical protein
MQEYAKSKGSRFEGTSNQGDFNEALQNAIAAAKDGLTTSFVTWKLLDVSGQNGGFVGVNDLTVSIEAQVH